MFFNKRFILASKSKSRQDILKNNKLNFTQVEPKCDEELEKKRIILTNTPNYNNKHKYNIIIFWQIIK